MLCIKNAQLQIDELNNIFKTHGLPYVLQFDYSNNITKNIVSLSDTINKKDLFLVLYVDNLNVSSIQCIIKSKFMYISSKTHELHLNKKYNLFLRAVIILIASFINYNNKNISYIRSFAINEYSEKCLKKYFIVTNVKNESCTFELDINQNLKIANDLFLNLVSNNKCNE